MIMKSWLMIVADILGILTSRLSSPPSRSCPTRAHLTAPTLCFPTRHWPCRCLTIYDLWSVMVAVLLNEQSVTAQCNMIIFIMIDVKTWNETAPGKSQNHCRHGVHDQLYLSTTGRLSSTIDFKYFLPVSHSLVQEYHSGSSETSDEASRQMVITVFAIHFSHLL